MPLPKIFASAFAAYIFEAFISSTHQQAFHTPITMKKKVYDITLFISDRIGTARAFARCMTKFSDFHASVTVNAYLAMQRILNAYNQRSRL